MTGGFNEFSVVHPVAATGSEVILSGSFLPDNVVTIVGIGVCCVIVIASVVFVFHQNLVVRQLRAKQALLTPAVYRAKLVSQSPASRRRHRKHHQQSAQGAAGDSTGPLSNEGRPYVSDTPPPLPVPPLIASDQSVIQGSSDDECLFDAANQFQTPVDECRLSPVVGADRHRSSSAAALLMLHHSGQLSLLPSESPPPVSPLTPHSLNDQRNRHRHRHSRHRRHRQQLQQQHPVSPAASRWSSGHSGGGHQLSVWSPQDSVARGDGGGLPLTVFRPSSTNRRRLMMVHDRLTVDDTVSGFMCDADARAAAAATAVAALGKFYSIPKQQQQQQNSFNDAQYPHHQLHTQTSWSPKSYRLQSLSQLRSVQTDCFVNGLKHPGTYSSANIAADNYELFPGECFSPLEKRPPVEGRDSMNGDNVADIALQFCSAANGKASPTMTTSSSATLEDEGNQNGCDFSTDDKNSVAALTTARYVPPTVYHLAERRQLVQRKMVPADQGQRLQSWAVTRRSPASPGQFKRSSSLSSLSDIVGAAGDSDMLEFDNDEYDDYYRAIDSAVTVGRLESTAVDFNNDACGCGGEPTSAGSDRQASWSGCSSALIENKSTQDCGKA